MQASGRAARGCRTFWSRNVKNCSQDRQFRFRDFLGSVEGQVWRVEPAIKPFVVSPGSNASSAFNADTSSRFVMQLRDLQILAGLGSNLSNPL
jgi:hypothetical protein